jgi:Calmodulin-binding
MIPEGMRIMPEEERLETLAILETNRLEVEQEIQKLPFVIETPSAVKHKNHLEKRLQEIEEATKIFSRSKVLVKI